MKCNLSFSSQTHKILPASFAVFLIAFFFTSHAKANSVDDCYKDCQKKVQSCMPKCLANNSSFQLEICQSKCGFKQCFATCDELAFSKGKEIGAKKLSNRRSKAATRKSNNRAQKKQEKLQRRVKLKLKDRGRAVGYMVKKDDKYVVIKDRGITMSIYRDYVLDISNSYY